MLQLIFICKKKNLKNFGRRKKNINKSKYPLLFEQLQKRGENILDIINMNNTDKIYEQMSDNYIEENEEEKNVFKFFEGHEKKTEKEIDNMNKVRSIN